MTLKELNNSLIFLIFSPTESNISIFFEKCFPFISLSPLHILFSMWLIAALSFWDTFK